VSRHPIAEYALLSDCHSATLVHRSGSVDWLCFPRHDAPSAREVFERAAACVNDLGLMAEEVDGATGELLGNFPQAFSHVGLVNADWAIAEAEAGRAAPATGALR
jgi:GH15 family glucan-1,4-alpha-glucosidase